MSLLRSPEKDRKNRQMTVFTTLAPPWSAVSPWMWIWAARALTREGSWVDDWKSPEHGGHLWSAGVSSAAASA